MILKKKTTVKGLCRVIKKIIALMNKKYENCMFFNLINNEGKISVGEKAL